MAAIRLMARQDMHRSQHRLGWPSCLPRECHGLPAAAAAEIQLSDPTFWLDKTCIDQTTSGMVFASCPLEVSGDALQCVLRRLFSAVSAECF